MKQPPWETAYVLVLFATYLALWHWKRSSQTRATGHDPDVLARAKDPLQLFFARATTILTGVVGAIIPLHALGLRGGPFLERVGALDAAPWDAVGFAVGCAGLGLCAWAQRTMGASWRVGIDAESESALVTSGIYRYVRNPTYLGLFTLNAGLWLVWPTPVVAMFALAFYLLIEMQVRCEEAHLLGVHGEAYKSYAGRSARYLPWIY